MTEFGATLQGVEAWVPHARLAADSEPSIIQVVQTFIPAVNSEVSLAVGRLDHLDSDTLGDVMVRARGLVELRAAIMVMVAQNPEQAAARDSPAMQMLASFLAQKTELAKIVASGGNAPEAGSMTPSMGVAWSKPLTALVVNEVDPRLSSQAGGDLGELLDDILLPEGGGMA